VFRLWPTIPQVGENMLPTISDFEFRELSQYLRKGSLYFSLKIESLFLTAFKIPLFLKAFCLTCKFLTASVCEMTPSLRIVEQTSLPPNSVHIGAMVHHGNSLRLAAFQFVWVLKRSACVSNAVWPNTSKNIPMLSEIDTFFLWPTMAE